MSIGRASHGLLAQAPGEVAIAVIARAQIETTPAVPLSSTMSASPTDSTYTTTSTTKRRRTSDLSSPALAYPPSMSGGGFPDGSQGQQGMQQQAQGQIPPGHIPKRGARACTACRKGKNRCEGEVKCPLLSAVGPSLTRTGPPPPPGPGLSLSPSPPRCTARPYIT